MSLKIVMLFDRKNLSEVKYYIESTQAINSLMAKYIIKKMRSLKIEVNDVEGSFYVFPLFVHYKKFFSKYGVYTSKDLSNYLIKYLKISSLPASNFGLDPKNLVIRISTQDFSGAPALIGLKNGESLDGRFVEKYAPSLVLGMKALENLLKVSA